MIGEHRILIFGRESTFSGTKRAYVSLCKRNVVRCYCVSGTCLFYWSLKAGGDR